MDLNEHALTEAQRTLKRLGVTHVLASGDLTRTQEAPLQPLDTPTLRPASEQVRAATNGKLSRNTSRTGVTREDAEIIEEASDEAASVVLAHRADLSQWRGIANKLCAALAEMDVTEDNHDKFARSLNAGVDAQLKVIKGERQAYNLDTEEGDKSVSDLAALMDELSTEA